MHLAKIPDFGSKKDPVQSLHQLHAQMKKERPQHLQNEDDRQLGKQFFMDKKFDVGEFESDLKNIYSQYFDYAAKEPAKIDSMDGDFKDMVIEEAVNSNQRTHLKK